MIKAETRILAVIPARGGSKRFPNKNLALLNNKTLLEHAIDFTASNSKWISKVVVSTDDLMIANKAKELGVDVIARPAGISGDHTPTSEAIKHALELVQGTFDLVLTLQPTNPLRPPHLLSQALEVYHSGDCDSVFTVQASHKKLGTIESERFRPINYAFGQRSQDMSQIYFETGLLYLTEARLISEGIIFGPKLKPLCVDHPFSDIDIDVEKDLIKAEFYLKQYSNESNI